jgi:hypothetical protein
MSTFSRYLIALAVFVFCAASVSVGQQTTTRVSGTVKDTAEAVVPGVKVVLTDTKTNETKTVNTNDEGAFVIVDVRPGSYMLTAERANFKKLQVQNVIVNVDTPVNLTLTLEAGGVAETVSVTASDTQSLIRSEDAKLSTTVDVRQVQDLPLNGRNPINLAGGMAGVNSNTNIRQSVINGLRGSFSNITWDGIEINDNLVRTDSLFGVNTPSVAGVAEFTLTTQNAGPDEGLGIAQVKLTTPRGGKNYHGSLYDFYRNSKFDANTFFNNNTIDAKTGASLAKPLLLQHQYGGNIGGPFAFPKFGEGDPHLAENHKLFFYFYYEKTNTTQDFTPLRTVLSAGARTGNFSYLATCGVTGQPACPAGITNGSVQTVNVLTKTGLAVDPRMSQIISLTPASNNNDAGDTRNTQGFRFNTPNGSTGRNIGFRIDYDVNSKNRIEAVYTHFLSILPNDVQLNNIGEQFPGLPGGGQQSARPRVALAWISSLSSSFTNEARAGFSSSTPLFFNREKFDLGYRLGLPLITNPIQNFLQQGRAPRNYDVIDNVTWVKGNHVLKFGASSRFIRILNFNDGGIIPQYTVGFNSTTNPSPAGIAANTTNFPGGISSTEQGNAANLLALLTGNVASGAQTFNVASRTSGFSRGVGSRRNLDYNTLGIYAGDTWRFRENLSLNLGVRWEYISPLTERSGLGLMPKDTSLAVLNNPLAVLDFAGKGTGREFTGKDMNNFAPNFSFAWDPFKSGKTSIRGGFAVSYAIDNNATVLNNSSVGGNAGLQSTVSKDLSGTVSGAGIVTLATPVFKVPRTLEDQLTLSQAPTLFTTEFNLATPYAAQWNFGIEREVWKDTALSVGYVGNRGVQLTRGIDTNQVVVFQNGFFQDFLRAQNNLALSTALNATNPAIAISGAFNAAVPGSQTLTIFPKLGAGGNLANSTIRTLLSEGRVGELASNYINSRCTFFIQNPAMGCLANFGVGANTATLGPEFFLPANKNAFVTDYIGSSGWSSYHGLQAEIRKRLTHGWYYQVNYTWSKAFTNAEQAQAEFSPYLDNTIGDPLEKKRNNQDVHHIIKANAVYELPFGPGKQFLNGGGIGGKLLGGWQISGIAQWRTGRPISFISGRGTVNRNGRSGNNTANTTLTIPELQSLTGLFHSPITGLPLLLDPKLINLTSGRASTTYFSQPAAGTFGSLSLTPVDGPGYWNVDTALIKRTKFSESLNLELRLEAFNVFNHTNFSVDNSLDINSTSFGKITSAFDPRILQLSFKFNF